ncbi:MAG: hypothetical protein Q8N35_05540 [Methylococcaceae bacterium]|nr:hypothetical protein [Methylococcaceae bacterium]MDP3019030.1 hypothetical protein [Methylococcaceae bacterium]MDP3390246.1 hypothetical protein [Methylococcaceae bacterium]MDZ4156302.1 hypothetical protein [Methylococcales bacterium]
MRLLNVIFKVDNSGNQPLLERISGDTLKGQLLLGLVLGVV